MRIANGVKVAVFNPTGQVLLIQRAVDDNHRPDEWDMPGGGIDLGEDFLGAAVREVSEEAGIILSRDQLKAIYSGTNAYPDIDLSINRVLFIANIDDNPAIKLGIEHHDYKWVDIETALKEFSHDFYNTGLHYAIEHKLI